MCNGRARDVTGLGCGVKVTNDIIVMQEVRCTATVRGMMSPAGLRHPSRARLPSPVLQRSLASLCKLEQQQDTVSKMELGQLSQIIRRVQD